MKKLGIGLLAAALSLPIAFAATQSSTPSTQTQTTKKTARKHTMRKKHANNKKSTNAQSTPQSNPKK